MGIEVKNLTKSFDGKKILDDISFKVDDGKILSIVGFSGSGKSTVLKLICGLLDKDSGEINTTGGDLSVSALSNEIVDTLAVVVGGAGVALNGGFVNTTIGKNIDNTPEYVLSEEDAKVYDTALKQLDESLSI